MKEYKLDRNHFEALTLKEADINWSKNQELDWKERLQVLLYLNSIAYQYIGQPLPRMDRTAFEARKLCDG